MKWPRFPFLLPFKYRKIFSVKHSFSTDEKCMEHKGIHINYLNIVSFTSRVSHIRRAIESIIKASNVEAEDLVDRIMEQLCRTRIGEYCYNQIGMG